MKWLRAQVIYIVPLILLVAIILFASTVQPSHAQEQPQNQAGVVIRYGNGQVTTSCVKFSEPSLTGLELLQRSGAAVIAQQGGVGAAVCKIGAEGCDYPSEDCFCKCKGADCNYWAYQRLQGNTWAYSQLGAAAAKVLPGDVDGWAWGAGSVQQGAAPPVVPIEAICAAPADLPTPRVDTEATRIPPARTRSIPSATVRIAATTVVPTQLAVSPTTALATATYTPRPTVIAVQPTSTSLPTLVANDATAVIIQPAQSTASIPPVLPTPNSVPISTSQPTSNYLLFAAIVLVLIGAMIIVVRRRR